MKKLILFILLIFTVTAFGQSAISRSPLWYMSGATTINPLASTWSLSGITNINYTGAGTGATLALGGATIGTNALAVTGTSLLGGGVIAGTTTGLTNNTADGSDNSYLVMGGGGGFGAADRGAYIYLSGNERTSFRGQLEFGSGAGDGVSNTVLMKVGGSTAIILDQNADATFGTVATNSSGTPRNIFVGRGTFGRRITSGMPLTITNFGGTTKASIDSNGVITSTGNINIGATTAVDTQSPDLVITGDADSDGTATTTEALTIALTSNATPTLATWGFTSTQGSGYTFDKTVSTTGGIIVGTNGGEIDSAKVVDGNLDAFVGGVAYSALQTAYGDAYIVGTSPQTISIATDSVYYTVKTWTSGGVLKNVTAQDSSLTATVAGVYSIEYNIAFSTTNFSAGNTLRGYIFVDDVQQDKTGFRRYVSGTNDTGSASGQGIISLTANQVVKLKIEGLDDGDDGEAIIHNANLKLVRID